ncbi:PREDICTED: centromere protein O-like isoform X2 [Poecilia mexicana]|uniref:centromere protein O-like isoform X2 n=1 Tax=Poecilia mexicana TaxID=48701 RepID=UPI00072DFBC0|nr:PREDICTED: centromere protein O-like isoform X2 [Poecilia mexicana]
MEGASTRGVLCHLSLLEVQARSRGSQVPQQPSRVKELKAKVEALTSQRDQLKAELQIHKKLQKLRAPVDKRREDGEDEEMDVDSESSELFHLMARHSELTDLLHAHNLIGGYDAITTNGGKGMCFSLATEYEGAYLDTYKLELNLKPKVRISRHNIPPFIPLNSLAEQSDLQTDVRAFLATVSQHLNAFAGRKQQLKLVKDKTPLLCTLEYTDHTRCLPTRVHLNCQDKLVPDSPNWKKNCSLLKEVPVHRALTAIKKASNIV